jgi:hypothetical protein
MKVKTDVKSGALAQTAVQQVSAAATGAAQFVNRASEQASSLVSSVGQGATAVWQTLFG